MESARLNHHYTSFLEDTTLVVETNSKWSCSDQDDSPIPNDIASLLIDEFDNSVRFDDHRKTNEFEEKSEIIRNEEFDNSQSDENFNPPVHIADILSEIRHLYTSSTPTTAKFGCIVQENCNSKSFMEDDTDLELFFNHMLHDQTTTCLQ